MQKIILLLAAAGILSACEMNQVAPPQQEAGEALSGDPVDADPNLDDAPGGGV